MPWFSRGKAPPRPINWKVNLAAILASQFFSLSAFNFCLPFLPLYLKNTAIVGENEVMHWAGVLQSVASVAMMIMAPIWGSLGDRYGRKMMLVRANLSGAFVLYLMGMVHSIEGLIVLRLLHGAFTGTTTAAQTPVATNTPDRSQGFAIGLIMASISAGQTTGTYLGGVCAKYFGPVFSFKLGVVVLFASTVLVVAAVRESFSPPEALLAGATRSARMRRRRAGIESFKAGLPLMLAICLVAFLQTYDGPFLALYVESLFLGSAAAASLTPAAATSEAYGLTGSISALASAAAITGSIVAGVIMDRKLSVWLWIGIIVAAGGGSWWVCLNPSLFGLAVGRAVFLFFMSGIAAALIVVLGRMTPSSKRGTAMGWSVTARAMGWVISPLIGASVAHQLGWREAYAVLAVLSLALVPMFIYLLRRYTGAFHPEDEDRPSIRLIGDSQVSTPPGQGRLG